MSWSKGWSSATWTSWSSTKWSGSWESWGEPDESWNGAHDDRAGWSSNGDSAGSASWQGGSWKSGGQPEQTEQKVKRERGVRGGRPDRAGRVKWQKYMETGVWDFVSSPGQGHIPPNKRTKEADGEHGSNRKSLIVSVEKAVKWEQRAKKHDSAGGLLPYLSGSHYVRNLVPRVDHMVCSVAKKEGNSLIQKKQKGLGLTDDEVHACLLYLDRSTSYFSMTA